MRVRVVNAKTATNPVARALARKKLSDAMLSFKLWMYTRNDGDPCADRLDDISLMLATLGVASELDPKIGGIDTRVRVLRGGLSACQQLLVKDKWDTSQTVAIERAIECGEELNRIVGTQYIAQAHAMQQEIFMEVAKNEN
jgi:hypothetical protein